MTFHIITHTHLDLGWIRTEQQYFWLLVKNITDSMINYMSRHPDSKFTIADIGFLYMHHHIDPTIMPKVRELVEKGQIEIVNGAYVQNDHAATGLDDFISNYQFGRKFVKEHLGVVPETMWCIDQFGQSMTASRLARLLGYNQMVIARMSDGILKNLRNAGDLLLKWQHSDHETDTSMIYKMPKHYETADPLRIDNGLWSDLNQNLYLSILESNFSLADLGLQFYNEISSYEGWYKSSHYMIPFGGDFQFSRFGNLTRQLNALIIFANSNNLSGRFAGKFKVKLSLPHEFFEAVKKDTQIRSVNFQTAYKIDFFPLVEKNYTDGRIPWSGYFSSHPFAKKSFRSFGMLHRGLRAVASLRRTFNETEAIDAILHTGEQEWIVAGNSHHDTITGTSKSYVQNHYLHRQLASLRKSRLHWRSVLKGLIELEETAYSLQISKEVELVNEPLNEYYSQEINPDFKELEAMDVATHGWDLKFESPVGEDWVLDGYMKLDTNYTFLIMSQGHGQIKTVRILSPFRDFEFKVVDSKG